MQHGFNDYSQEWKEEDIKNYYYSEQYIYIKEHNNLSMSVYPNPTTGQLTVKRAETLRATSVQMFDVVGKVVGTYSISPENTETVIDVSQLQPGVYVLKIGNYTGRFVKE